VVDKVAQRIRIPKIHPQADAGIFKSFAVVIRDVNGIAKKRLVHSLAAVVEQHEMQLMNMECMQVVGPVLDDPILYCSLLRNIRNP
jgi:glycine cleavage system regulatory protein